MRPVTSTDSRRHDFERDDRFRDAEGEAGAVEQAPSASSSVNVPETPGEYIMATVSAGICMSKVRPVAASNAS